jgi:hypothetical protein
MLLVLVIAFLVSVAAAAGVHEWQLAAVLVAGPS